MTWTRWTKATAVALLWVCVGTKAAAQSDPATPEPPAPTPEATAPPENPPWWGGKNSLYLEVGYGSDSVNRIDATTFTGLQSIATNDFRITDTTRARVVVGWQLPLDRGRFLIEFEGMSEDSSRLVAEGLQRQVLGGNQNNQPEIPLPWWSVVAENGDLTGQRNPPLWNPSLDDANFDGIAQSTEVRYGAPDILTAARIPDTMQNRLQTYDLLFARTWGGRRIWGNWSAGLRHLVYRGNIPTALWLNSVNDPGLGFTDGEVNRLIAINQDATGWGPTGTAGVNFGFARRRLVLYAELGASFLLQDVSADTGEFFTYTAESSTLFGAPARLRKKVSKSTWNTQGEIGAQVRILEGTHLLVSFRRTAYMDVLNIPVEINTPSRIGQASQGATAVFNTRDIRTDVFNVGLSFQF